MARGGPRVGWRPDFRYGGVAQLVEHLLCKQGVIGSNPFASIFPSALPRGEPPGVFR